MSAIDETWEVGKSPDGHGQMVCSHDRLEWAMFDHDGCLDNDIDRRHLSDHRVRLAACAPEAIRMLLEAEWCERAMHGMIHDSVLAHVWVSVCNSCVNERSEGHKDDCAWLALMRKAGLR